MTSAKLDELVTLIKRHTTGSQKRPDGIVETAIEGVYLSAVTEQVEAFNPTSGAIVAVIAQGAKRIAVADRAYSYGAGQFLVASVDLPVAGSHWTASTDAPALGFGMTLRPTAVAELLAGNHDLAVSSARGSGPAPALGVGVATDELLDAVIRMVRLLDSRGDRQVLAPLVEREILWRLVSGPVGETVAQLGSNSSGLSQISRAVERMRSHCEKQFRVDDLAGECGMSTSTFHRNFQAVTGYSPIQFQKQIRLRRARTMLMTGHDDVATVGFRVGYESASQFSREYRREFGIPPGRDRARLRAFR